MSAATAAFEARRAYAADGSRSAIDWIAVHARLPRGQVSWIGLVLNERGLDRAIAAGMDEVNVVVVATDTFIERNQGGADVHEKGRDVILELRTVEANRVGRPRITPQVTGNGGNDLVHATCQHVPHLRQTRHLVWLSRPARLLLDTVRSPRRQP